jgi:16S rRNA (cytosine967-C5)-methyltransferase
MTAPNSNARALAVQAMVQVLRDGVTLDSALAKALVGTNPKLKPTVHSLGYGAVRGYFRYHAMLSRLSSKPLKSLDPWVRCILSVAFFELEDARTPQYAVVDAAVETAKSGEAARAAGLINAVLRRYLRERVAIDADIARKPASCHASPAWLADRLRADWPGRWTQLLAAGDTQAPMWLRVNARVTSAEEYRERLAQAGMSARVEERVPHSLVLQQACDVHELPGFAEGVVSVQDVGAQCVMFPLDLGAGQRVLDACAAPGGKTALMAEREPKLAELIALDVDEKRLQRVRENLDRGHLMAQLIVGDAAAPESWWDGRPFDRILLDAPCSALGVIRRHPDIRVRKSPADIDKLPALQAGLLKSAWSMLAAGGRLVYATCTITRSENRDVLAQFLDSAHDARIVPSDAWPGWPNWGESDGFGRQILPGEAGADGFYYAALTKQ